MKKEPETKWMRKHFRFVWWILLGLVLCFMFGVSMLETEILPIGTREYKSIFCVAFLLWGFLPLVKEIKLPGGSLVSGDLFGVLPDKKEEKKESERFEEDKRRIEEQAKNKGIEPVNTGEPSISRKIVKNAWETIRWHTDRLWEERYGESPQKGRITFDRVIEGLINEKILYEGIANVAIRIWRIAMIESQNLLEEEHVDYVRKNAEGLVQALSQIRAQRRIFPKSAD